VEDRVKKGRPWGWWVHHPYFAFFLFLLWFSATYLFWVLAFYPLPDPDPFLQTLREICFGTTESGIPSFYGWLQLIVSPLALLGILLLGWRDELKEGFQIVTSRWGGKILLALLIGLSAGGLSYVGYRVYRSLPPRSFSLPDYLPENYPLLRLPLPSFSFVDPNGSEQKIDRFPAPFLLTFAYGHCLTVCPVIVKTTVESVKKVREEGGDISALIVTLDPERDTPSRLPFLQERYNPSSLPKVTVGWVTKEKLLSLTSSLNYPFYRDEKSGEIVHPSTIYLVDENRVVRYIFQNPPVEWVVEGVRRIGRLQN
jgi:protein SCO1/2